LQTLVAAGGKVVLSNVIDYGVAPITRQFLTDPAGRERVTDAIRRVNTELAGLAQQYGVPLIDGFQATKDFLGTNQAPVTTVAIGGVDFANAAGVEPQNLFVDDGIHPHTVGQAVIANLVVEAIRLGYGQDVDAIGFTEREMLELVGLGSQYVSDTLNLDYADYVILPNRWQNPLNNWDVSGDGKVHPIDALKIINYINAHPGDPSVPAWPAVPPPFFDVTGDNAITPADVLTVINYINSHSASGEGEPTADAVSGALAWAGPSDDTALDQAVLPRPTVLNGLDGRSSRDLPSRAFHRPREIARGTDDLAPPDREPVRWPQVASRRWDLGAARPDVLGGEFEETLEQIAGDVAGAWSAALRGL
jgi:hypothetical protein